MVVCAAVTFQNGDAYTIQHVWNPNGSTGTYGYHFNAVTTDPNFTATSETCWIYYNPVGPGQPAVTFPAFPCTTSPCPEPTVPFGGTLQATFAPNPAKCGSGCPVEYTYQVGPGLPVTVSQASPGNGTWNAAASSWTGNITMTQFGPATLTVTALSSGFKPGEPATPQVTGTPPANPAPDGYFSGGAYPDLLAGNTSHPGLWLSQGTGNGALAAPGDIGNLGNGVTSTGGTTDWTGALLLHGNFMGHGVQDVMAYWPKSANNIQAGAAYIVAGLGQPVTVNPANGNPSVTAGYLSDGQFCDTSAVPSDLVAAGNASQSPVPSPPSAEVPDLIGTIASSSPSCGPSKQSELVLYTAGITPGGYGLSLTTLSTAAPDANTFWDNYTLATAQLPDTAYPQGDPSKIVLLALDNANGHLWETANPGNPASSGGPAWTQVKGGIPWGSTPAALASADVGNATGPGTAANPEIWTIKGSTATAYQVVPTGGSRTQALCLQAQPAGGQDVGLPADSWPLADGALPGQGGTNPGHATDTVTTKTAPLTGTYTWEDGQGFPASLGLSADSSGNGGFATPPSGTILTSGSTWTLSVWFKTTVAGGVIASLQASPLTVGGQVTGGYDPVLYVGSDGYLNAEWMNGTTVPIVSATVVDDGQWHHAVLAGNTMGQTLTLDNQQPITVAGAVSLTGLPNLDYGSGYIGGGWPDEPHQHDNNIGYPWYFQGQLAAISFTHT